MKTALVDTRIIYLVDDDDSFRKAISRLLTTAGYLVRSYSSAAEFLLDKDASARGCILLDVRMPGGPSGLELQKGLIRQGNALPIIFLTGHGDIPMSVRAIKDGAFDFLTKPVQQASLISTINAALAREATMWEAADRARELKERFASLSPAERAVYQRIVLGEPNKQITESVGCSERTVKAHRSNVMTKMRASSLAELIHFSDHLDREL